MQPTSDSTSPVAPAPGTPGSERPLTHALAHEQRRARKPFTDRRFGRSRTDRVLGGVCGGVATFIGVGSVSVRVLYAASVLVSLGATAVGYLLLWLLIPHAAEAA